MQPAISLREAAWPTMFAGLQMAYAELTLSQIKLERRVAEGYKQSTGESSEYHHFFG